MVRGIERSCKEQTRQFESLETGMFSDRYLNVDSLSLLLLASLIPRSTYSGDVAFAGHFI